MVSADGGKSARRPSSNVAAGSVWESRMRIDQVRGGIKVFSGGVEKPDVDDMLENRASEQTYRSSAGVGLAGKRRACKTESNALVGNKSPSQLLQRKNNSLSFGNGNGSCRSPVQLQRKKSASDEDDRRSSILISKSRSDLKVSKNGDSVEANELDRSIIVADDITSAEEKKSGDDIGGSDGAIEKGPIQLVTEETKSDEENKDIEDESVSVYASREDEVEEREETIDEKNISLDEEIVVEKNMPLDEEFVFEKNISTSDYRQMNLTRISHSNFCSSAKQKLSSKPTIAVARSSSRTELSPVRKPPRKFSGTPHSFPIRVSGGNQGVPQTHSKLQSIVDLVMWKYVPRSSLVFGSGTFLIISSSYTRDLEISFISVTSYLGLIYLAIVFLYKSFKCGHIMEANSMNHSHGLVVIGEEEAVWVLRLILPYVNEFLLKIKALFSGDPAVTIKLAAALFALARCGNSITIWKMVKLGFFAAFILPKFCSSYSAQITGCVKFWIHRFHDAWRSCSHKKVVGFAIFTMVWNLSSFVSRIWAAFMLFAAVRYYQHSTIKAETWDEDREEKGRACNDNSPLQRPQGISKLRQGRHADNKGAKKYS